MPVSVNPRPQASLGRVLDNLGTTFLELVHGDPEQGGPIGGVAIHDPLEELTLPQHALVLGVGIRQPQDIIQLLGELGRQDAAGLVLRAPVEGSAEVLAASDAAGVTLLGLTRGASWAQLAAMLRSLLAEGDVGEAGGETLGGLPSGDLFAVANAVAALLDAPVTIEDLNSRVLAFSGRQDEADPSRVETVLGRQVPERFSRVLVERGVFRDLYRADRPLYLGPLTLEAGMVAMPRVAVAVRAGDDVLGSIWVAVKEPLSENRMQALSEAARVVALHLLRIRAGADVERRLRADLVSTALEGGGGAVEALSRLGLAHQPVVVLALATLHSDDADRTLAADARLVAERQRLSDGLAMHLSAVHSRCATALVGDVAYGLLPVASAEEGERRAIRIATDFLDRVGDRTTAVIGVGPAAHDAAGLAQARISADRALRVLRSGAGDRVARLSDVQIEALVLELRDLVAARGDRLSGPIARLAAYDAEHNSNLLETLQAWLDAFGDVMAGSAAICIHSNTFRYRLRRITEVGGIDLSNPEARFAAMLQLRLVSPSPRVRGSDVG
jgi:hypothetical protein